MTYERAYDDSLFVGCVYDEPALMFIIAPDCVGLSSPRSYADGRPLAELVEPRASVLPLVVCEGIDAFTGRPLDCVCDVVLCGSEVNFMFGTCSDDEEADCDCNSDNPPEGVAAASYFLIR